MLQNSFMKVMIVKKSVYLLIILMMLFCVLCGCDDNQALNSANGTTEGALSEAAKETSVMHTNVNQENANLILKNSGLLSEKLNVPNDISNGISNALLSVGAGKIVDVTVISRDERVIELVVTDEAASKYFLSLNGDGTLGVIYEESINGKLLYCEGRSVASIND